MKVNAQLVRSEREKRAWSQEHLASVSGLGVRTIHRIEKDGVASPDSVQALAAVFGLEAAELRTSSHSVSVPERLVWLVPILNTIISQAKVIDAGIVAMKTYHRLLITLGLLAGSTLCYWLGFNPGFKFLLGLGVCLELAFWASLFGHRRRRRLRRLVYFTENGRSSR